MTSLKAPQEQPDSQAGDGQRAILELFRKQCVNKHGGIGFEEAIHRLDDYAERLAAKRATEAQDELVGFVHRELGQNEVADRMKQYQLSATLTSKEPAKWDGTQEWRRP